MALSISNPSAPRLAASASKSLVLAMHSSEFSARGSFPSSLGVVGRCSSALLVCWAEDLSSLPLYEAADNMVASFLQGKGERGRGRDTECESKWEVTAFLYLDIRSNKLRSSPAEGGACTGT